MKQRSSILRITAFCLLLIFTQKIGVGLALHNFFHSPVAATNTTKQESSGKDISYACSCADDFLIPFTAAEEIDIPQPTIKLVSSTSANLFSTLLQRSVHTSLRGPPVMI